MKYLRPVEIEQNVENTSVMDDLALIHGDEISQLRSRVFPPTAVDSSNAPTQSSSQSLTSILPREGRRLIIFSGENLRTVLDAVKSAYGDAVVVDRRMVSLNEVIDSITQSNVSSYLLPIQMLGRLHEELKELGINPMYGNFTYRTILSIPYSDTSEKYGAVSEEIISEADDKSISMFLISDNSTYINENFVREISRAILEDIGLNISDEMTTREMLNTISSEVNSLTRRIRDLRGRLRRRGLDIVNVLRDSRLRNELQRGAIPIPMANLKPLLDRLLKEVQQGRREAQQTQQQTTGERQRIPETMPSEQREENQTLQPPEGLTPEASQDNNPSSTEVSAVKPNKTRFLVMLNRKIRNLPVYIEHSKYRLHVSEYKGKIKEGNTEIYVYRVSSFELRDNELKERYRAVLRRVDDLCNVFGVGIQNLQLSDNVIFVVLCSNL